MSTPKERLELMPGWFVDWNGVGDFVIYNPGPDAQTTGDFSKRLYYTIQAGQYSPVIVEDDEHSFIVPTSDGTIQLVKGIICKSEPGTAGQLLYRGNLTNALGKDGGTLEDDGNVFVHDGQRYKLYRVVNENKNRIFSEHNGDIVLGGIGFYVPEDSHDGQDVEIFDLESIA